MPNPIVSIEADADIIASAAKALSALVHMASPELKLESYVTLRAKVSEGYSTLVAAVSCGVMSAEIEIGKCRAQSPVPYAEIIATSQFFASLGSKEQVKFSQEQGTGVVQYRRGRMSGTVAAIDPSSLNRNPSVSKGQTNKLPTKIIREALEATLFSSSDPNAAITGPIARLYVNGSDLEVVTYDSLCGAIYSKTIDGLRNGLKIVLPNRLLWTLLSFVNDDTFDLTYDPNVSLIFATKTCRIFVTLNEYPDIDVGTLIRNLLAGVTEGIRVNPNKVSHTVSSIIAVGAADKEITNLIVDHRTNKVRFGINSEAINCAEIVECEPASTKTNMSIIVDSKRFLNFLKPCKSLATVDILHGGGRVIVKAEHATFAFSVV